MNSEVDRGKNKAMSFHHREILRINRVMLIDDLDPEVICNYLIQDGVFTSQLAEEVLENRPTRRTRNSRLLDVLVTRGDLAFYSLINAIKFGSQQLFLVKALERDDANPKIGSKPALRQTHSLPNIHRDNRKQARKFSETNLEEQDIVSDGNEGWTNIDEESVIESSTDEDSDDSWFSESSSEAAQTSSEDGDVFDLSINSGISPSSKNNSLSKGDSADMRITGRSAVSRNMSATSGKDKINGNGTSPRIKEVPLPGISSLFRFIAPHIHSRWRELAGELGLSEESVTGMKQIPHDRPSKYATTVLEKWARANKGKATKGKLVEVLTKMNLRKALDAIEKYKVAPSSILSLKKNTKFADASVKSVKKKEAKVVFDLFDNKEKLEKNKNVPVRKKRSVTGKMKSRSHNHTGIEAHCDIDNMKLSEYGQKKFLDMTPKIVDTLLERGTDFTEILNNLKELRGIVVTQVRRGSIIVVLQPFTCHYLNHLMKLYESGELKSLLESVFLTAEIKEEFHIQSISLNVKISKENYNRCEKELLLLQDSCQKVICKTVAVVKLEPKQRNPRAEDKLLAQKLEKGLVLLNSTIQEFTKSLTEFQSSCSELLLTLNLVQPVDMLSIRNLEQLHGLAMLCEKSSNQNLRLDLIQQYMSLHNCFCTKLEALNPLILNLLNEHTTNPNCDEKVLLYCEKITNMFDEVYIMLEDTYDFSGLSHIDLPKLVIREQIAYQGLLSYFLVLVDMLTTIRRKLQKLMKLLEH